VIQLVHVVASLFIFTVVYRPTHCLKKINISYSKQTTFYSTFSSTLQSVSIILLDEEQMGRYIF
jgi:hypothetical protein